MEAHIGQGLLDGSTAGRAGLVVADGRLQLSIAGAVQIG